MNSQLQDIIKPPRLEEGSTVGLISPSAPLAGLVPHRVEHAKKVLTELGFKVVIGRNALKVNDYLSGSIQERVDDMHSFFSDKDVSAIISFIGGNHSNQLLRHLDFDLIKNNPKIVMGYSDMTVLHLTLNTRANLVSFYGPAALTQFAENPSVLAYTKEYFTKAVMKPVPIGNIYPSKQWTDEVLDWFNKEDLTRPRQMRLNPGYQWLRKGQASGRLIGGCITSLLHLRGTDFWPSFEDAILFWETPESSADFSKGESVSEIDAALTDLDLSGVFSSIQGMIIGRPFGYTPEETDHLKRVIIERAAAFNFPILFGVDIGHTDPMITVPIGVQATMDSSNNTFCIIEAGVH